MGNQEQTMLLVSDDAALCAAARRAFEAKIAGLRVTVISSLEGARRILEEDSPAVILLDEDSIALRLEEKSEAAPRLDAVVSSLAVYSPVVVIGTAEHRPELTALIAAGAADYVVRDGSCLLVVLGLVQRRLRQLQRIMESGLERFAREPGDFGEILRHELNNPLTGILGNAELLLAELHRRKDDKLPHGGQERVETIAALAVRLRETVRRLSQEWEERRQAMHGS